MQTALQIAINYSPQAQKVIEQGALTIGRYKLPDWDDLIAEASALHNVYVHFPLHTGRGVLEETDFERVEYLRAKTNTPYVNTHLSTDYTRVGTSYDDESASAQDKLYDATMRDIEPLIHRWGTDKIIIENAPTNRKDAWHIPRAVIQPAFISRVVESSGVGFLLDTAHAWLAAHTLDVDKQAYLDALPTAHLRELHITGTQAIPQQDSSEDIYHDHFAMRDDDWTSAEYALDRIKTGDWGTPWIVALEYGGVGNMFAWRSEEDVIERDLGRLQELCATAETQKDA
jgi:uncharacterized protein (UPF0276 family)